LYGTSLSQLNGDTCNPSDPSYDSASGNLVASHAVTLTGLQGLTKYYVVHRSVANGATATYAAAASFTTLPGGGPPPSGAMGTIVSLAVGDYNNDFNLDIGVGISTKNHVIAYLGNGLGGFTKGQTLANVGTTPTAITSGGVEGDFNEDGYDDLAVANYGAESQNVAVFLGTPPSGFQTTAVSNVLLTAPPTGVATGDFNEDSVLDLAVATVETDGSRGHLRIFPGVNDGSGHGTGHFGEAITSIELEVANILSPTVTSIEPSSVSCTGLPQDVTIFGTLLLDSAQVLLDDMQALQIVGTSADNTSLRVRIPEGVAAGTHSVVVRVGPMPPAMETLVVAPRTVSITGISPASRKYEVDSSGQVSIVGANFVLGATVAIGPLTGTTVAGTTASATNPFVFVSSNHIRVWVGNTALPAGGHDVTVTNPDACAGTATVTNGFTVAAPVPTISSVAPTPVTYGITSSRSISISGTNFVSGAIINVGGVSGVTVPGTFATATTPFVFVSDTNVRFYWTNTSLPPTPHSVTVTNPAVAGGESGVLTNGFTVLAPEPSISSLSPPSETYGVSSNDSVAIYGANFLLGAKITVGTLVGTTVAGLNATATTPFVFVNDGQLRFYWANTSLPPETYDVRVENPGVAGGLIATAEGAFVIDGPQPTLTSVSPTPVTYGITGSSSITIYGSNFVVGSTITVGGLAGQTVTGTTASATTPYVFVNKTQLKFYWPNTSLAPGSHTVQVTNPPSAGELSATLAGGFTVTAPQPSVTNLSPNTVTYGITSSRSISVYGANFLLGARITVGSLIGTTVAGLNATATNPFVFVNDGQLRFYWPNNSLPPTAYTIQVANPAVGGGVSTVLASAFTVSPPQPAVGSVSPSSLTYGVSSADSVTIGGSGFVLGATISVGSLTGTTVAGLYATATTPFVFVSDDQLEFYWTPTSLPAGSYPVTVTNPPSAGTLTTTVANGFVVAAPQPVVDPSSAISLSYGVTSSRAVNIYGSGFVVGAYLNVGGILAGPVVAGTAATASNPFVFINSGRLQFYWPNTSLPVGSHFVLVGNQAVAGGLQGGLVNVVTILGPTPSVSSASPSPVTYGSTSSRAITIYGSNFVTGGTITVGTLSGTTVTGTNATASVPYVWVNNTQVRFWWPNTSLPPGTYNVTYTNSAAAGGQTATLTGGFVVQ
jgi:hypothetical protein